MSFRLRLTAVEDPMPLEFTCTIGYVEYLRDQLQGRQQPIHPCLIIPIRSFATIGPRLGVYLDGTPYNGISQGKLGDRPDGYEHHSLDPDVENTEVGLTLEVDEEQLIELYTLYQAQDETAGPPYTWVTTIPKERIQAFDRQTSILNGKLKEALSRHVPYRIEGLV